MAYTRREFGRLTFAGLPAAVVLGRAESIFGALAETKPNSLISGVQIGLIVPYSFGPDAGDAETILKYVTQIGISAVEMQNPPAEAFAGAPTPAGRGGGRPSGPPPGGPGRSGGPGGSGGEQRGRRGGGGRQELTPEQQAEQRARAEELKKWRLSVPMDKYKALRKMYNDAGVKIYAFKLGLTPAMSVEEYDYTFNVAEALGANHLTMELPTDSALTKRIGEFAAKRKMMVGYHAHTQATPTAWDEAMSQSKYNGINLDAGHYVAGTSESPIPVIQKHHDRITSMHLKDRKKAEGPNMPWGHGDTPLAEILQLMKKEKYKFPATIELEYPVPDGSTRVAEIGKCFDFCKRALGPASATTAARRTMNTRPITMTALAAGAALTMNIAVAAQQPGQSAPRTSGMNFTQPSPIDFNDHEGYVSLFDGVSLKGWDGNTKFWRVEDGAIVGESTPQNPSGNSYLVYRDVEAKDFTLKFEIKIEGDGGSGLQYRSKTGLPWLARIPDNVTANVGPVNLNWMMTGPQADFWPSRVYTGQFYSENTPMRILAWRGQVVEGFGATRKRLMGTIGDQQTLGTLVKMNDWNQYTVIARGGTFIHIVNGQLMAVMIDDDPSSSNNQSGQFGIEIEATTKVFVRNIWLKKLN